MNRRDIESFPINLEILDQSSSGQAIAKLGDSLMARLVTTSEDRTMSAGRGKGMLQVQCIFLATAKPIIDQIDVELAEHYRLSQDAVALLPNYKIKYPFAFETSCTMPPGYP